MNLFGLKMGADDFIRNEFPHRLLVERIKVLLRRATPRDGAPAKEAGSNVLERGQLRMDRNGIPAPGNGAGSSPSLNFSSYRRWQGPGW